VSAFVEQIILNTDFRVGSHGRHVCPDDWAWEARTLPNYDLWYVAQGTGRLSIGANEYALSRGRLFFFLPGDVVTAHQEPAEPLTVYFCRFDLGQRPTLFGACVRLPQMVQTGDDYVLAQFDELVDSKRQDAPGGLLLRRVFLINVFRHLLQGGHLGMKDEFGGEQTDYARLKRVTEYIEENLSRRILVSELARFANSNRTTLARLFTNYLMQTPHQYVSLRRVERAKVHLAQGVSIKETAARCGFSDVYSFGKLFKKLEKCTPGQFVRENAAGG